MKKIDEFAIWLQVDTGTLIAITKVRIFHREFRDIIHFCADKINNFNMNINLFINKYINFPIKKIDELAINKLIQTH